MGKYLNIDEQTASDLSIFGKSDKGSVYQIYNKTITQGGSKKLEELFKHPLSDEKLINEKVELYRFFSSHDLDFPVDSSMMGSIAYYLENQDVRSQLHNTVLTFGQRLRNVISTDADYVFINDGVQSCLRLFYSL